MQHIICFLSLLFAAFPENLSHMLLYMSEAKIDFINKNFIDSFSLGL